MLRSIVYASSAEGDRVDRRKSLVSYLREFPAQISQAQSAMLHPDEQKESGHTGNCELDRVEFEKARAGKPRHTETITAL